jgi:hypothetical protein
MKTWEYNMFHKSKKLESDKAQEWIISELNKIGAEGWEIIKASYNKNLYGNWNATKTTKVTTVYDILCKREIDNSSPYR